MKPLAKQLLYDIANNPWGNPVIDDSVHHYNFADDSLYIDVPENYSRLNGIVNNYF
jgi:hypothetical protein